MSVTSATLADHDAPESRGLVALKHLPLVMAAAHWHSHVEIFLLTSGRIWTSVSGQEVEIGPGRVGMFWSSYPHRVTRTQNPGVIYVLYVPTAVFREWPLSGDHRLAVMKGEAIVAEHPVAYQSAMFEAWASEQDDLAGQQLVLDEARNLVRRIDLQGWRTSRGVHKSHEARPGKSAVRVERMIRFIEENHRRPDLRVEDVAGNVGLHPNYAMARFRATMGVSIGGFIAHTRLAEAQQLLLTTKRKISAIAADVGFASPSRFYSVFQQRLGTTPTRYRNEAELYPWGSADAGPVPEP